MSLRGFISAALVLAFAAVLVGGLRAATSIGTSQADILRGTPRSDHIYGRGGNDQIFGLDGGDVLVGGRGDDRMYAGPGADDIRAADGMRDSISCGRGPDRVRKDSLDRVASDCELVNPQRLDVFVEGNGVVRSIPKRIGCPSSCSKLFSQHTLVHLIIEPGFGSAFTGWGGACSGTGDCGLRLNSPKRVTAVFAPTP